MKFDLINIFIEKGTKIKIDCRGCIAAYSGNDNYDKDIEHKYDYVQYLGNGNLQVLYANGKPQKNEFISCGYLPTTDNSIDLLAIRISQNCNVYFRNGKMHCETVLTHTHRVCNFARYIEDGKWILESCYDVNTQMPVTRKEGGGE